MKQILVKLCCLVLTGLSCTTLMAAKMVHTEHAAEVSQIQLGSNPLDGGIMYVKRCDHCRIVGVSFHAGTVYFNQNQRISASQAMILDGNGATIFYSPESKLVTRVVFWNRDSE